MRSPQRDHANKSITSFSALQDRAKQFFNDSNAAENVSHMLQLIEDFCREGDKLIDEENEAKKNLQAQVGLRKLLTVCEFIGLHVDLAICIISHFRSAKTLSSLFINRLVLVRIRQASIEHK